MSHQGMARDLRCIFFLDILNRTSSLDTSDCEARCVWKAANNSGLPLQWTLNGLVELCRITQVDHIDVSIRRSHNQKVLLHIQGIDALLALHAGNRLSLSQIPVLDGLVPRACDDHRCVRSRRFEVTDTADGLVVCCNLGCCILVCCKIDHTRSFVCSSSNNF